MKQLNLRFIISNIITAILLFFSVSYYRTHFDQFNHRGAAPWYGLLLATATVIGMISMNLKSYDLASKSPNKIQWHGKLFLFVTYLGAFISNIFILVEAEFLINTEINFVPIILLLIIGFIMLVLESHFLSERPKRTLPIRWVKLAERGSMIYSSVGISSCWNHFVIGSNIHETTIFLSIFIHIVLMIVFVFSFQRLFWYEIITSSETLKDNMKTFFAIMLVFISGILPIYLV